MSELTDQIQELSDNFEQLSTETQSSLDEHSQTIDDQSQTISDVSDRAGQLDFPLTPDSITRVKEIFPTGTATLSGGSVTVNDQNIQTSSVVFYSVVTSVIGSVIAVGNAHIGYSYTLANGQITFTSTIASDASTLVYVIF